MSPEPSYTAARLLDGEMEDAKAICGIIARDIRKTGSFFEARENYAFAYSKGKKINPDQAQSVLNDIFKAQHGQSMNQMREALIAKDQTVMPDQALPYVQQITSLIQAGDTMPFYKALDQAAGEMANDLGITQKRAKTLMSDAHAQSQGRKLYDVGKELEATYHTPVAEAQKARRALDRANQAVGRSRQMKASPLYNTKQVFDFYSN